jgi:hypothetical protein
MDRSVVHVPSQRFLAFGLIAAALAGCAAPGPRVSANPNPVIAPRDSGLATTTISWSTGNGSWGQVFLSHNNGPEQLYVQGAEGTADAPWIGEGQYEFRLYAGQERQRLLALVTVERREARTRNVTALVVGLLLVLVFGYVVHRTHLMPLAAEAAVVGVLIGTVLTFWFRVLVLNERSIPYDIQEWHYPQLAFLGHALARGDFPLWNPHIYGGMSFVGEINAALFYPVNLVVLWIGGLVYDGIPYRLIEFYLALHYFLAGWGAYWLSRTFQVSIPGAVITAVIYMCGPYLASQAQHLGLVMGAAWTPFVLVAARRSIERSGWLWPTALALALAVTILTGFFPATAALGVTLLLIYVWAIGRALATGREGAQNASSIFMRGAWAAGLALGLSAIQLLPFVELGTASIAVDRPLSRVVGPPLATAVTTFIPQFFNGQSAGNYWSAADLTQSHFYLPPLVVVLAVLGAVSANRRDARWLSIATVAALLVASREITIILPFFDRLPATLRGPFELFTFRLFYDLGIGLLAGLGFEVLLRARGAKGEASIGRAATATLAIVGMAILTTMVYASRWLDSSTADGRVTAVADNARVMLGSSVGALIWVTVTTVLLTVALRRRQPLPNSVTAVAAFGLIVIPLFVYGSNQRFNTDRVAAEYKLGPTYEIGGRTGVVSFLQQQRDHGGAFRIENSGAMGWRWATATQLWSLDNANGDDPLLPADTRAFLAAFSQRQHLGRRFDNVDLNSPLLNLMNVRYVVGAAVDGVTTDVHPLDADAPADQFPLVFADWYKVFENRSALPRALMVPNAQVVPDRRQQLAMLESGAIDPRREVLLDEPPPLATGKPIPGDATASVRYTAISSDHVRLDIRDASGGMLLVLDPYWPGWVATIDGAPSRILRANYLFRAVPLSPGNHVVEMTYEPRSLRLGALMTAVSLVVAVGVAMAPRSARLRWGPRLAVRETPEADRP